MRISDWSSDVFSSDLDKGREAVVEAVGVRPYPHGCGLLKGEGEGIEDLRRAKPAKLVGARLDVDAEMRGVAVSDAAADPVGSDHEVVAVPRSEEHTSELQSLMSTSYAAF